jgi:hypothetical protein
MIRILETPLLTTMQNKYIKIYCDTRKQHYPIEYTFLVTKIKFQDWIIDLMLEQPSKRVEINTFYRKIKSDNKLQEKCLKIYEKETKRVQIK